MENEEEKRKDEGGHGDKLHPAAPDQGEAGQHRRAYKRQDGQHLRRETHTKNLHINITVSIKAVNIILYYGTYYVILYYGSRKLICMS